MINTSTVKIVADTSQYDRNIDASKNKTQSFDAAVGSLKVAAIGMGAAMVIAAGVRGISAMVSRSMQLRDEQAKLADRLGITTQSVAALTLQSELSDMGSDGMERALQKMTVRLQDAAEKGGPVADAIEAIGLNVYQLASKKPDEAFFRIADAIKGMGDEQEKLNRISDIFGDKSLAITSMINEGRDGFDAAARKAEEFGTAISRVDAAKLEAANDSFTLMHESIDGAATRISIRLAPLLQYMAESLASITTETTKFLGLRTEEEELNHLLAERAEIIERIEKIQRTTNDTLKIAHLRQSADALRAEINVILNKQQAEASAFIASDKIRLAEEAANAKRLENAALETAAIKNKKAAIDAELQSMRDREAYRKELQAELTAELASRAEWNTIYNDAEIQALQFQSAAEEDAAVKHNQMVDEQMALDQLAADNKRALQESINGNAIALMQMLGAKNKNWARAAIVLDKALAIAKIKAATEVAAMNAAAAAAVTGPQAALAAAASMRSMGLLSMGLVAGIGIMELSNLNTGGGSSASGSGTGGAPGLSPYGAPPVALPMEQRSGSINIYISGAITEAMIRDMVVPVLRDEVDNRDLVLIRSDSRNGQILSGV